MKVNSIVTNSLQQPDIANNSSQDPSVLQMTEQHTAVPSSGQLDNEKWEKSYKLWEKNRQIREEILARMDKSALEEQKSDFSNQKKWKISSNHWFEAIKRHKWTIVEGIAGASIFSAISKVLSCWSLFGLISSSLATMFICSRLTRHHLKI